MALSVVSDSFYKTYPKGSVNVLNWQFHGGLRVSSSIPTPAGYDGSGFNVSGSGV